MHKYNYKRLNYLAVGIAASSCFFLGIRNIAIAQVIPITMPEPTPTSQPIEPLPSPLISSPSTSIQQNGVQFNNGIQGSLTPPSCNQRLCGFAMSRLTPNGSESLLGVLFQLGGSADDTRADAEKAKVEIDRIKGDRDYLMQLRGKLASAIEEKKTARVNIFAIELAKLEGYKSHIEYLKAITTGFNYR
jgi:hypothetical protein